MLGSAASVSQASSGTSGGSLNLFLGLSAVESMSNMQYLNINHSKIALGAYWGLSSSIIPNWIAYFNTLNSSMLTFQYGIFEQNQFSSLYLDNVGNSVVGIMVYSLIYFVLGIISLTKTKEQLMNTRVGKVYVSVFGLFISTIAGQTQSQVLFSAIQLIRFDLFVDLYTRISYIMAYLLSAVLGIQIWCFFKVKTIFDKKTKIIEVNVPNNVRVRSHIYGITINNLSEITASPSIDDRWNEMKYAIFFDTYKETSKHSFFFNYWMTLYDVIYILLILFLQNVPVLQCLSIVILIIICILISAYIKPFKEKGIAFVFFFNFVCVLLVAVINLILSIRAAVTGITSANDYAGSTIFFLILASCTINMIFGFSGIFYTLFPILKSLIKKIKSFMNRTKQNTKTNRPRSSSREKQEDNRRINLQINDESLSRNNDFFSQRREQAI